MTDPSLGPFFAPRSVAVVGASRDPSKVGGSVLANLRSAGFDGRVIPVNARAETVQRMPAVPSLLAADGPVDLLDRARDRAMGFSLFASLGNQADLTESDLLRAAAEDPETRVIVGYIEGVADGRRFFETLREATASKPVLLLKAGRSDEGARAVSSHTGALAGPDLASDAAVRQAGAVRARSVEELFDLAQGLASQPLRRGRRLLIATNGGGLGIVAADAAHDAGLHVQPLDEVIGRRLEAVLPPTASVRNPVDLVGDADAARYGGTRFARRGRRARTRRA